MLGICSLSPWLTGHKITSLPSSSHKRKGCTHLHPKSRGVVLQVGSQASAPLSSADPPRQVSSTPLVSIQLPKARLAAPKYLAQRPGLVGTSQGRLGSTEAPGRGSGWEMQEAGLVSLSGVQINRRFHSLEAAKPAPVTPKNQKSIKKQRWQEKKEIRKAKNKAKSSSCNVDGLRNRVTLFPPTAVPRSCADVAGAGWWRWEVMLAPWESSHSGLQSPLTGSKTPLVKVF